MSTVGLMNSRGETVKVGDQLGTGGEGTVYEHQGSAHQVLKLYHTSHLPDAAKQQKLRTMVTLGAAGLLNYTAWPLDTLHNKAGQVVGFIMPRINGYQPLHALYSPAHRRQMFPQADWGFLVYAARNTAAAFATLHSYGHVIGDVNQGNVLVNANSQVVLIDCDSFQIQTSHSIYYCPVGVAHFTPPELQGSSSFTTLKRTVDHDNFGLALLIFHLMFGGRHPYSGKPLHQGAGQSLEADIKHYRYAYAHDAIKRGFEPPPASIPLSILPSTIQLLFEQAFTESGTQSGRPSAAQWVIALDELRQHLTECWNNNFHHYPRHLVLCPWCELEKQGLRFFQSASSTLAQITDIEQTIKAQLAAKYAEVEVVPLPLENRITHNTSNLVPNPYAVTIKHNLVFNLTNLKWLLVLALNIYVVSITSSIWMFFAMFVVLAFWLAEINYRKSKVDYSPAALQEELEKRLATQKQAQLDLEEAYKERTQYIEAFTLQKITLLDNLQACNQQLSQELVQLLAPVQQKIARHYQTMLKLSYLMPAPIPLITASHKATLIEAGIRTAADIEINLLRSVLKDEVLVHSVMNWHKRLIMRYSNKTRLFENELQAVHQTLTQKIQALNQVLEPPLQTMQNLVINNATTLNAYDSMIRLRTDALEQARVDIELVSQLLEGTNSTSS